MTTELQAAAQAAQKIPGYCTSGHGVLTQQQWQTCWNAGWNEPVNGTANVGYSAGHNVAPWLIALLIIAAIAFLASRGRSRTAATSN